MHESVDHVVSPCCDARAHASDAENRINEREAVRLCPPKEVHRKAKCLLGHVEMVQCVLRRKGYSEHAIDHAVTVVYCVAMPYINGTKICNITNRRAWVFKVAFNAAILVAKRDVCRQTVEPAILATTVEDSEPGEEPYDICDALRQLTRRQSEAIELCFLRGMSLRAAAKEMGIAVTTLSGHLSAAKERLKEILHPIEQHDPCAPASLRVREMKSLRAM